MQRVKYNPCLYSRLCFYVLYSAGFLSTRTSSGKLTHYSIIKPRVSELTCAFPDDVFGNSCPRYKIISHRAALAPFSGLCIVGQCGKVQVFSQPLIATAHMRVSVFSAVLKAPPAKVTSTMVWARHSKAVAFKIVRMHLTRGLYKRFSSSRVKCVPFDSSFLIALETAL